MSSLSSLFLVAELSSCLLGCVSIRYIIRKESFIILKMQVQRKGEFIETSLVGWFSEEDALLFKCLFSLSFQNYYFLHLLWSLNVQEKMPLGFGFILAVFPFFFFFFLINVYNNYQSEKVNCSTIWTYLSFNLVGGQQAHVPWILYMIWTSYLILYL